MSCDSGIQFNSCINHYGILLKRISNKRRIGTKKGLKKVVPSELFCFSPEPYSSIPNNGGGRFERIQDILRVECMEF